MTRTEQLILNYIQVFQEEHRCTPNTSQIAYHLGWTSPKSGPANVRKMLIQMEEKELISIGQPTRHISLLASV